MAIYTATFAAIAVSAAQDCFEIVAPADATIAIREVRLGQYSDFGDAAAEIISVQIIRGYTVTGSGGAAVTPSNIRNHTGSTTSGATVARNNTTVATTGTVQILVADAFNVQSGWWYRPFSDERIIIQPSARLVVRVTAPADAVTMNGTLVFEEGGLSTP